ncbi:MAG: ComF family protein [Cyanobacteria bacterium CRU_2_1]|nr:ComF family protein [Cyanobacteria bacterium RU_5_0]NJR61256.1 ComF family protein [Cyanobacteria bacterium CRU_2_1]
MGHWTEKFTDLLNLFIESRCPLCQRSTHQPLCLDCQRQIQHCQLVDRQVFWQEPLPLFVWGKYGGALKRSIASLKYDNQPQLARPLGHWLAQAWLATPQIATKSLTVVPIPMHPDKQKKRGFNQAELLAKSFCEVTGLPLQCQGLARIRATEAQFGLSSAQRQQNLKDAFQLGDAFYHRRPSRAILLLDDIYTTGATAKAAIETLQQHHISVYGLITIAKTIQGKP